MNPFNRMICKCMFKAVCIISALTMIGYWLYKFEIEDRDVGVVDYVPIDESLDIPLPVPSVCIKEPFLEARMLDLKPVHDVYTYLNFLEGSDTHWGNEKLLFDENLTHVDYFNVTLNLKDYVTVIFYQLKNDHPDEWRTDEIFDHKESFNGFSVFGGFEKCFEIKNRKPNRSFRKTLFSYNLSTIRNDLGGMPNVRVSIHYPGQYLLRPRMPRKVKFGSERQTLMFDISDIEVIKGRNSRNRNCTPYDKLEHFDDMVREQHLKINKCRPPYLKSNQNFSNCNTKKSLQASYYKYEIVRDKYYPPSCQRISKIVYEDVGEELDLNIHDLADTFSFGLFYPESVRMILQSKEVDIHALIGNIGGYIGLFLGDNFDHGV